MPATSKQTNGPVYPLSAVRTLALHAQGLADPSGPGSPPDADTLEAAIRRIGWLQIDTLQVVNRSQYVALWSRLGTYEPSLLDGLLSEGDQAAPGDNGRRLFEYWLHAACVIPLEDYRYRLPTMRRYREGRSRGGERWLEQDGNASLIESVLDHVKSNGAARSADFDRGGPRRGAWWDWKPAKRALEHLYDRGDLMIAGRRSFQRVYDLRERVLPEWVDQTEPTEAEAARYLVEKAMRALGVCEPTQLLDYCNVRRNDGKPVVEELIRAGTLVEVQGKLADGEVRPLVVHRDALETLDQAADGALTSDRTTFLSPFDSLFWAKGRDQRFWGFRQILEAYKPEPIREWGYFCLAILHGDRLVGRFDPKMERRTGTLRLKCLYLEPGVEPDDGLVSSVATAMRDFMAFHGAHDLVIERSTPTAFAARLTAAL